MPKNSIEININRVAGSWSKSISGYNAKIREWVEAALPKGKGELSVVLADDEFVQTLNKNYRSKDKPTNVLSFPGSDGEIGDIILAFETVKKEAKEQNKAFARHAAHLIIHACLHLSGFDHENQADAEIMEAKEIAIMKKLNFPNPYEI
ncbi:MAG: rRNA maturation RNase YbeY [Pseudomonadota bacterium]